MLIKTYFNHISKLLYKSKGVYPHVRLNPRSRPRSCPRSRPHPQSIQYCSSYEYPLVRSRSRSHSRSCSSDISLVIESERERTGADADAHVDTLLYADVKLRLLSIAIFNTCNYYNYKTSVSQTCTPSFWHSKVK